MREPRWITRAIVEAIHLDQIREHGGLPGIRDESALEAALARPMHKWFYDSSVSITECAAAYAFGIARSHPFYDGNKRTAFLAAAVFLFINGWQLDADEADVVRIVMGLAAGKIPERAFAVWLKELSRKVRSNP